jgi:hypothetical protein
LNFRRYEFCSIGWAEYTLREVEEAIRAVEDPNWVIRGLEVLAESDLPDFIMAYRDDRPIDEKDLPPISQEWETAAAALGNIIRKASDDYLDSGALRAFTKALPQLRDAAVALRTACDPERLRARRQWYLSRGPVEQALWRIEHEIRWATVTDERSVERNRRKLLIESLQRKQRREIRVAAFTRPGFDASGGTQVSPQQISMGRGSS